MTRTKMGEKIRTLRKAARLTLDELAEKTDSSKSYIWELENRPTPRPSAEKIQRIASVLGVVTEFLLDENRSEPTASQREEYFFQRYSGLSPENKEKLEKILDLLDDE